VTWRWAYAFEAGTRNHLHTLTANDTLEFHNPAGVVSAFRVRLERHVSGSANVSLVIP
jgi:hypothetical protein